MSRQIRTQSHTDKRAFEEYRNMRFRVPFVRLFSILTSVYSKVTTLTKLVQRNCAMKAK